jgi:DNA-binding MarR family transcriptional regulator
LTAEGETLRWLAGKAIPLVVNGDVYGRKWDEERLAPILAFALKREYHQHLIHLALKEGHASVRDIAERTGLDLVRISRMLTEMEKANRVVFKGHHNRAPQFEAA